MMTQYCGNFQQLLSLQRNSMEIRSLNYSVVSIKQGAGNKQSGLAEFFHLLHEKRVMGGTKSIFIT